MPLHIWLPVAHPVAPSNASALLSGVMIKTGIYGLTRVLFDFMGTPPNWWGVTVLTIGTISAVLGVLYALMEHDLKRLLAYHSIENIGIILMGLGASLMFLHTHHPVLATLALIAGLYHTINHAIFKALLFLGAGAVLHATHTRNMEEMGGLIKRMPKTAFFFLIGRGGHFGSAAAQRVCERMAHLPVVAARLRHHRQPGAADVPAERRDAGADRRAGGGVFREGLRHHVPGPAAQRAGGAGARGVPDHAAGHGPADGGVRVPGAVPDGVSHAVRSAHAAAHRPAAARRI